MRQYPLFAPRLRFAAGLRLGLFLVVLGAGRAQAQSPESGGPAPQAVTAVPLDGGASLLLAAGVAYGLKRLRRAPRKAER